MTSPVAEVQTVVASAGVLRAISYELRQPLGTIDSLAYYLRLVLPRDWILTSGLQLADPSPVAPSVNLNKTSSRTAKGRGVSRVGIVACDIRVAFSSSTIGKCPWLWLDR